MVSLGNIMGKMMGGVTSGWLFLSYDLDTGDITAVRRVAKDDPQWADWNRFVNEQVDRCFAIPTRIPNERVYAFSFAKLDSIPYLNGESNNHFIEFVSKSVPVYQLGIFECGYAKSIGVDPTRLRNDERNYDGYNEYVAGLRTGCDLALFEQTVQTDSKNYGLLYDLVDRYTDMPEITERQIELLNGHPSGLRIFSVLEELFCSSDYADQMKDVMDYDSLIYTPVASRKGIHYLRAELEKFDISTGRKLADDPQRERKVMELTLYIRRYEIRRDWVSRGPEREWFTACVERLTNAETIAREIRNFACVPTLTRTQLQYLVRMGTTSETLFQSGIMGDVIMETPYFKEFFGMDMAGTIGRTIEKLDRLVIDAARLVIDSSLKWLCDVIEDDSESEETRRMALEKIPQVEGYLSNLDTFIIGLDKAEHTKSGTGWIDAFHQELDKVAARFSTIRLQMDEDSVPVSDGKEVYRLLTAGGTDMESCERMVEILVEKAEDIPYPILSHCISILFSSPFGQVPENRKPVMQTLTEGGTPNPFQQLSGAAEYRKIQKELRSMNEEMEEKKRTERRIQNEINDLYDKINNSKTAIRKLHGILAKPSAT